MSTAVSPWSDAARTGPFGASREPGRLAAAERLKDWTRERFSLEACDTVVVSEAASTVPGFPPRETAVAFWTGATRHHYTVFKALADVTEEDVPPAWLRESLALSEGIECACC